MRSLRLGCALIAVVCSAPLAAQTIAADAARDDFDVLWKSIREAHGGLTRHATISDLNRRVAAHRSRIVGPMESPAFAALIQASVSELRDGHMRIEQDSATQAALRASRLFPLRVVHEDGRLIVAFNDAPPDSSIRPGMSLVSVNGRSADDLVRQMMAIIPGDGFIETGKRYVMARNFAALYWLYVDRGQTYDVVVRDQRGRQISARLPGVLEGTRLPANNPVNATLSQNLVRLDGPPGNVALEYPGNEPVARLRVRAFDGSSFTTTLDSAFRALRDRGVTSLILDLRGNGGGVDDFGAALVSQFTNQSFRYFDRIHVPTIAPSFATWLPRTFDSMRGGSEPDPAGGFRITSTLHRGVAEWPPAATPFLGNVVVLIDGGTFSTAADVAAQLRSMGRATFVGEETGGGYEGNTSGLNASIVLPNSRLRLRIMMYDYWNAVKPPATRGRGTMPDRNVLRRVADVLQGTDPAVREAIQLLKAR